MGMSSNAEEAQEILDDLVEHYERFLAVGANFFPLGELCNKVESLQAVVPIRLAPPGYILPGIPAGGDDPHEFKLGTVPLEFMWNQIETIRQQLEASK